MARPSVQNTKPRIRQRTDSTWFSHLLRHLASKWTGSTLPTPESTTGPGPGACLGLLNHRPPPYGVKITTDNRVALALIDLWYGILGFNVLLDTV